MYHDLTTASLLVVSLAASLLTNSAHADAGPFQNDTRYDEEAYGAFPVETFRSSTLVAPRLNAIRTSPQCDDGLYTFLAPYGWHVQNPGPTILDNKGHLVWKLEGYGHIYNFKAQETNGQSYLTYWTGDDTVKGHGSGHYHILDQGYNEVRSFGPANDYPGDHHEYTLTDDGHAIVTIYAPLKVDMTPEAAEPTVGWIWECMFQELHIETKELKFEWKASEHFTLDDVLRPMSGHGSESEPLDWFHINSIAKDLHGNYLISARYTFAAHYISHETGEVLWSLGGKHSSFTDLSSGLATSFVGQHDVRWANNYTEITLFDNAADWETKNANQSRGVRTHVDLDKMTAYLVEEYRQPEGHEILSVSQGSMQVLPSGNALVGYGNKGAFSEFSEKGDLLCHYHFESVTRFEGGDAQSYRVVKAPWVGKPSKPPDIVLEGEVLFVSWNGATEVDEWLVQRSTPSQADKESSWISIKRVAKKGFETAIAVDTSSFSGAVLRVAALDNTGIIIGASKAETVGESGVLEVFDEAGQTTLREGNSPLGLPVILVACVGTAALLLGAYELVQRRNGRSGKGYRLLA